MSGVPQFGIPGMSPFRGQPKRGAVPYSFNLGDVWAPFNVAKPMFSYRFPCNVTLHNPCVYVGNIESPSWGVVSIEVWRNGQYSGTFDLSKGANQFPDVGVAQHDLVEMRVVLKASQESETWLRGVWIMWSVEV